MKKILVTFISFLAVLGGIAVLLHASKNPFLHQLGFEVAKLGIQLVALTIAGGVLMQEYNRRHERSVAKQEFRRTILYSLINAYTDTKKARRLLRAKCDKPAPTDADAESRGIPLIAYEAQMDNILDTELQLELLRREVEVFADAFTPSCAEQLRNDIGNMSEYLGALVTEYRDGARQFINDKQCVPIVKLPVLGRFTRPGKAGDYRTGFREKFYSALECLRKERLSP